MKIQGPNRWRFDTRDLMRVSLCHHCTQVSILRSLGDARVMEMLDPYIEAQKEALPSLAQNYGMKFETQIENELKASLPESAVQKPVPLGNSSEDLAAATLVLMRKGVPVIYQGGLMNQSGITEFSGRPDFLVRGDWRLEFVDGKLTAKQVTAPEAAGLYTAWDAKFARAAKPEYSLQVAIYIEALDGLGLKAEGPHGVILGSRTLEVFDESEIVPAMRLARGAMATAITEFTSMSPAALDALLADFKWHCDKASSCKICEYPDLCDASRHNTDDLALIHNIQYVHRVRLQDAGIHTMSALASASDAARPQKIDEIIWGRLKRQAQAQVEARETGEPVHWLHQDPQTQYLPPADPADVFFDLEGFTFHHEPDGLEYLFGSYLRDGSFEWHWADNHAAEKIAFGEFVDWLIQRLQTNPNAHVYHYGAYEKSALRRMNSRHGIKGDEVTWLEKQAKFVDLQPMVRNSMIVGEESYSIKKLERHYGYQRSAAVKAASDSMDGYEEYLTLVASSSNPEFSDAERAEAAAGAAAAKQALLDYNREDVESTMLLTNWLAGLEGATTRFGEIKDPKEVEGEPTANELRLQELEAKTAALFSPLEGWEFGVRPDLDLNAQAWGALTHSILFYQRERTTFWSDLWVRLGKEDYELELDRKAAVLQNVVELGVTTRTNREGREVTTATYEAEIDPEGIFQPTEGGVILRYTGKGQIEKIAFGKVESNLDGRLVISRELQKDDAEYLPNALFEYIQIPFENKQQALNELADELIGEWGKPENSAPIGNAAMDLLLRRPPRLKSGVALPEANVKDYLPALIKAVDQMDNTTLAVQGPPGSGKTYLASRTIKHLTDLGFRVGVVTNSHKACENLLEACIEAGVAGAITFKSPKSGDKTQRAWQTPANSGAVGKKITTLNGPVLVGGTSWAFCHPAVTAKKFDYLFVDEAAQFSMVDALAVSRSAKNLVLLGDPRQLPQVVNAIHPGGVANSALGHYMGDNAILPAEQGYFVEVTRRLHPRINAPVSWLAYNGRLHSHPDTASNLIAGVDPGIHSVPIEHFDNSTRSPEEVGAVVDLAITHSKNLGQDQVLVVSPYNAQVDAIRKALDEAGLDRVEVGTVDRFQGREALVVIISLAASTGEDAPRGLEFVLDRNRLNVAISRAKSVCYLVHSPQLVKSGFVSLADLKAVSRLSGVLSFAV